MALSVCVVVDAPGVCFRAKTGRICVLLLRRCVWFRNAIRCGVVNPIPLGMLSANSVLAITACLQSSLQ